MFVCSFCVPGKRNYEIRELVSVTKAVLLILSGEEGDGMEDGENDRRVKLLTPQIGGEF
jgi:hypothetical protein